VEEILPMFSHVLLLRAGKVLAAGPRNRVMTDSLLSTVFGAPVKLEQTSGRVSMRILRNNT
ncbi:MAG TPA: ABC transporter ATP-binding protein, partial [Opitutales bacterium]|nr:ABC transporter ATP-binding protein [Opitutales bacterium]